MANGGDAENHRPQAPEAAAAGDPPEIAKSILERRRFVLIHRLPTRDQRSLGFPAPDRREQLAHLIRDLGVCAVSIVLLIALAALLDTQVHHITALVIGGLSTTLAAVSFNNALYLRARRLHARQESARLDYERESLPKGPYFGIARVEKLLERLDRQERLLVQNLLRNLFLGLLLFLPGLGTAVTLSVDGAHVKGPIAAGIFEVLAAVGFVFSRNRARELESAVQQSDYELNLLTPLLSPEHRAERLYLKQQFELKRYYDEALRQSTALSYVGAVCVAAGFVVVGATLALLVSAEGHQSSTAVAIVGGVGGILANFVAVVFLQMHSGTIRALTEFQSRLVGTNHLHFANLLVARIGVKGVDPMQAEALRDIARAVAATGDATRPLGKSNAGE
jgi:hypothetical protein